MRIAPVVVGIVLLGTLASAQTRPSVAINGVITDASGAVIPDATIEARFGGPASTARSALGAR